MKKKICKVFGNNKLGVTLEATNAKVVNFLDVTMDLNTGTFKPFMKENDSPTYVNTCSNHPPSVLKSIPRGVNTRLSRRSSNKDIFDAAVLPFQEALAKSGFSDKLEYDPPTNSNTKKKNRRSPRQKTWFNPPFSLNVSTNVGREFLQLIDTAFPTDNPLHKLFTRNTLKIGYRCMPNMAKKVKGHNAKILKDEPAQLNQQPQCKCRGGIQNCPAQGMCETQCVVYRATVTDTTVGTRETYTGVTGQSFKKRWSGHKTDSRYEKYRHSTTLSGHLWELKDQGRNFKIDWAIIEKGRDFNPITGKCDICLKEKFHIIYNRPGSSLNKREEIFNTCRHRKRKLIGNAKT